MDGLHDGIREARDLPTARMRGFLPAADGAGQEPVGDRVMQITDGEALIGFVKELRRSSADRFKPIDEVGRFLLRQMGHPSLTVGGPVPDVGRIS